MPVLVERGTLAHVDTLTRSSPGDTSLEMGPVTSRPGDRAGFATRRYPGPVTSTTADASDADVEPRPADDGRTRPGSGRSDDPVRQGRHGWRLVLALVAEQRRGLMVATLAGLVWSLAKVAVPQLTRLAIDRGIVGDGSLWWWSGIILAAGGVVGVNTALRRWFAFRESRIAESRLRQRLYDHLLGLHIGYHDRAQSGQLMTRASSDLQMVQGFVVMVPLTVSNLAMVLGVVVVLVVTDPLLALIALAPLPLVNLAAKRFSTRIHPAVLEVQSEQGQLAAVVEESVVGVRAVKGFGAEGVQAAKLASEAEDIRRASTATAIIRSRYLPALDLLPTLGVIAVLGLGGHRVLDGAMTLGELVAFNASLVLVVVPLRTVGMTIAWGQRAAAALERVDEVMSVVPAITDPTHPSTLGPHPQGAVRFDHVVFGYDPDQIVLHDIDLDIAPGRSIALVGATASGKSTLARLLVRFYDVGSGAVRIDGVDVRDLSLSELRRTVGVVFDEPVLLHDTVAANVAFARPDATRDEIRRAIDLAGAAELLEILPEGLDTVVGERGLSLSGGQRQRLAIARVLLGDPRILVLDDATSSVDSSKEHEIRDALATVMHGRTTIVIAHRPATIALADEVAFIDEGRLVARGDHEDLLARDPRYGAVLAQLAATERGDVEDEV